MPKTALIMALCGCALLRQMHGQDVFIGGDESARPKGPAAKKETVVRPIVQQPAASKENFPKAQPVVKTTPQTSPVPTHLVRVPAVAMPTAKTQIAKAQPVAPQPTKAQSPVAQSSKPASAASKFSMPRPQDMRLTRVEGPAAEPSSQLPLKTKEATLHIFNAPMETASTKLADGFDFPVGKPDAQGYYKARGFRSHGHLGEDWDGIRGGDTDLGDPIYSIGDGIVVFARDCHMGWGNVLIVRHTYREAGTVKTVDALYGHLNNFAVRRGQIVSRGQKIATMGNAHGLYDAHLHLEVRKNIEIGMSRSAFAQDSTNYYDPSQFIATHRHLQGGGATYRVAMNTFVRDSRINWAATKNYSHSHHGGGTGESAVALKKAVAATKN
ncbi:MAG: hypothetical protein QOH39_2624 [Verrucomicrobiota bacterium]|jgi:murein DD-endopeptidase MepM/ murein hydrolase activator NlpD